MFLPSFTSAGAKQSPSATPIDLAARRNDDRLSCSRAEENTHRIYVCTLVVAAVLACMVVPHSSSDGGL